MPSANKMTTPVAVDLPVIQGRYADLDGYTVGFESYPEDVDPAPFFAGLPDDRCQCPHWGVVQSGQITFRWADHEETYGAGDAYYAAPGHLPLIAAGTSVVEFSPTEALGATMAVIDANLAAAS
ncbi:MAG TPA: cupin domain-containing protein [Nocardioides sp.]|nr:cupin domain-containing protein [Nocardioides sp.]